MKKSNILSTSLIATILLSMFYCNYTLKSQYDMIDLEDQYKNYVSIPTDDFNALELKGSNGYAIQIKESDKNDVKVLRSRVNHFSHHLEDSTLLIEFTGSNVSKEAAFNSDLPIGVIVEFKSISNIKISDVYSRLSSLKSGPIEVELKGDALVDISDCQLEKLTLTASHKSNYVFSKDNSVDTFHLDMQDQAIGRLNHINILDLEKRLGDSVTLVLSKHAFENLTNI